MVGECAGGGWGVVGRPRPRHLAVPRAGPAVPPRGREPRRARGEGEGGRPSPRGGFSLLPRGAGAPRRAAVEEEERPLRAAAPAGGRPVPPGTPAA